MALAKPKIPLALNTPIDTKSDEFLTPGFSALENVRHKKTGGLIKRNGYSNLTQEVANTSGTLPFSETINGALALKSYKDELVLLSTSGLYSYSAHNASTSNSWLTRDFVNKKVANTATQRKDSSAYTAITKEHSVINTVKDQYCPKYLETADYKIYLCTSSNNEVLLTIRDSETDATIVERAFQMTCANIAIDSTYLYITGRSVTSTVIYYPLSLTNLNEAVSPITITGISFSTNDIIAYDVISDTTQVFAVFGSLISSQYNLSAYLISGTTFSLASNTSMGADFTTQSPQEISIVKFNSEYVTVHGNKESGNTTFAYYTRYNAAGLVITSPTQITGTPLAEYISLASDSNFVYVTYTREVNGGDYSMFLTTISSTGTFATQQFYNHAFSQSHSVIYDNNLYVMVRGYFQNTGHLYMLRKNLSKNTPASIFGKNLDFSFRPDFIQSNRHIIGSGFCRLVLRGDKISTAAIAFADVVSVSQEFSTNFILNVAQKVSGIEYSFDAKYPSISLQAGMLVAGSAMKIYDGASYTELGFMQSPVITSFTAGATSPGGDFPNGTYGLAAVYRWTDAIGNIHRSAPRFETVVVSGGPVQTLDFSVRFLAITEKEDVSIEYYLTDTNGATYYRTSTITANDSKDPFFSGSFSVRASTDAQILYTLSGELENDAPSASLSTAYFKNRVFNLSRTAIEFSKPVEPNAPVEFNGNQVINLGAEGGDATGIAAMDSNLIIFKEDAVFILNGEGPNALGQQSDYGNPQLITTDTGCIDTNSIVAYPNGLIFKSKKGIYEINRGLSAQYIGAQVNSFNQYEVLSSQLLKESNEVRFVLSNGQIIVYDYFEKQWEVDTLTDTVDAVSHNNVYYKVTSDTVVSGENNLFFDNYEVGQPVEPYAVRVQTNWIQISANGGNLAAGVQQFQRLYRIHLLGRYKSEHTLQVGLSYNYDDTIVDTATLVYDSGPYQFEVKPTIQKCEAVKITLWDTNTSLTNGESMELSSILLEVGIKGSGQKQTGDSKSFPTV